MPRRLSRILTSVLCALSMAAALPAAAGAVVIGIGDNNPATFSSPRFRALGIRAARTVVPWNVASDRSQRAYLAQFRAWYAAAQSAGVTPLISFGADFTNPAANYIPTTAQYQRAVRAFIREFPAIKQYTAWNEPDWPYRRLAREPSLAANYFNALYNVCHGCTVLAGDLFLPTTGPARIDGAVSLLGPWLRAYVKGLHHPPAGWALHDYTDVRGHTDRQLLALMQLTRGPVWLDETGGVLTRGHWQYRNQSAAAANTDERYLLGLAVRFHRITHIYHYQWQSQPGAGWDSALLTASGKPRPAYWTLYDWLHPKHHAPDRKRR